MLGFYAGLTHSSPLSWLAAELGADAQPLIEHSRSPFLLYSANMFGGGSVNPYDEIVGE